MFFSSGFPFGDGGSSRPMRQQPVDNTKFYKILGVDKNCSKAEIKTAYRKLAIKHHPDKGGDAELFKDMSRAYEVLSDPEKRRTYDEYGEAGLDSSGPPQDATDIFDMFINGGARRQQRGGRRRGEDVVHSVECTLEQCYQGAVRRMAVFRSVICSECEGHGGPESAIISCPDCNGKGVRVLIRKIGPMITQSQGPCSTCQASGNIIPDERKCRKCHGTGTVKEKKILEVNIEKGAPHDHKIVFSGEADERPNEIPGDAVFILQQKPHALFERRAYNLMMDKTITLYEALTGVKFVLTHLDNRKIIIQTPPNTVVKPQMVLGVPNEGMPVHHDPFNHGDLFIVFRVDFPVPKEISNEAKEAFKKHLPGPGKIDENPEYEVRDLEEIDIKTSAQKYSSRNEGEEEDDEPQRLQCRQQ